MSNDSQLKEHGQKPVEQPRISVLVNDWLHTTCGWPWWLVKATSLLVVVNDWLRHLARVMSK